jgi:hypothetical protein
MRGTGDQIKKGGRKIQKKKGCTLEGNVNTYNNLKKNSQIGNHLDLPQLSYMHVPTTPPSTLTLPLLFIHLDQVCGLF